MQISQHHFIETRVVRMWASDMNVAWKSATNCARTYMLSLSHQASLPANWQYSASLDGDHVFDAVITLSLLEDHLFRNAVLILPHEGLQADRLTKAMEQRNKRIYVSGQSETNHFCSKCTRFYKNAVTGQMERSVSVLVMDGITLGHLCCAISNCKEPLVSSRDRYCGKHRNENDICAIVGCSKLVVAGTKTCKDPLHRTVEATHDMRSQARFQLKERLRRARVAHPADGSVQSVNIGCFNRGKYWRKMFWQYCWVGWVIMRKTYDENPPSWVMIPTSPIRILVLLYCIGRFRLAEGIRKRKSRPLSSRCRW